MRTSLYMTLLGAVLMANVASAQYYGHAPAAGYSTVVDGSHGYGEDCPTCNHGVQPIYDSSRGYVPLANEVPAPGCSEMTYAWLWDDYCAEKTHKQNVYHTMRLRAKHGHTQCGHHECGHSGCDTCPPAGFGKLNCGTWGCGDYPYGRAGCGTFGYSLKRKLLAHGSPCCDDCGGCDVCSDSCDSCGSSPCDCDPCKPSLCERIHGRLLMAKAKVHNTMAEMKVKLMSLGCKDDCCDAGCDTCGVSYGDSYSYGAEYGPMVEMPSETPVYEVPQSVPSDNLEPMEAPMGEPVLTPLPDAEQAGAKEAGFEMLRLPSI